MQQILIDKLTLIRLRDKKILMALTRGKDTYYIPGGKPEGTIVQMTCYTAEYEGEIAPSEEIEAIAWYAYADKEKTGPVDRIIFDRLYKRNMLA